MNLEELCINVCNLAQSTATFIKSASRHIKKEDIEVKDKNSLVTYVDKTSEKKLVEGLQKLLPGCGFITEEDTIDDTSKDYVWIVDPLDGTTNFIHNLPCYAISIGLMHQQKIILGVIYEINLNECFYAWKGGGSFLNGEKISVSATLKLEDSLLATGFPYYDYSKTTAYLNLFKHLLYNTRGVRRIGSAAVDLAYVACGRFDGFYEYSLNAWDVAAGIIIIQEAGGVINDFSGKDNFLFGKEMVASNPHVQPLLLKQITQHFK